MANNISTTRNTLHINVVPIEASRAFIPPCNLLVEGRSLSVQSPTLVGTLAIYRLLTL